MSEKRSQAELCSFNLAMYKCDSPPAALISITIDFAFSGSFSVPETGEKQKLVSCQTRSARSHLASILTWG